MANRALGSPLPPPRAPSDRLEGQDGQTGSFVVVVRPDWAPLGVQRFNELVEQSFFSEVRFFRVRHNFMAQFGISGDPAIAARWRNMKMQDDPVKESNKRGFVSYATPGKNSRTTQMFINLRDNSNLDGMGFSPFACVVKGMDVVDRIYQIGESPNQGQIQKEGNAYLNKDFPELTYIKSATIVTDAE
jgi:peptidyl-prolyl cis-trans isomerase A (cyclophilin A)